MFSKLGKISLVLFLSGVFVFCLGIITNAAGSTDNTSGYAWNENTGWISLSCDHTSLGAPLGADTCSQVDYGVLVEDDALYGYAWSENLGWISFNCDQTKINGLNTCSTVDYGVQNNGSGNLSGYAWAENIGWISFDDPSAQDFYQVIINSNTGIFSGYAWSENAGYINFNGTTQDANPYYAETSWRVNTAPASRLIADPDPQTSGDEYIACNPEINGVCNSPTIISIPKDSTLTFSGMVWDCDGISDIAEKDAISWNVTKDKLVEDLNQNWLTETEDAQGLMNCAGSANTLYPLAETGIAFSSNNGYQPNEIYDIYIYAKDEQGLETTSTIRIELGQLTNPYIPEKKLPVRGAAEIDWSTVILEWLETKDINEQLDPNNNFDHYEVYIVYPNMDPGIIDNWQIYQPCSDLPAGSTSCIIDLNLERGETYYWNVIAVDTQENTSHSPSCSNPSNCQIML